MLPNEDHVARVCPHSTLADGKPSAASFAPHSGSGDRQADAALSVHWLEHLCNAANLVEQLAALRSFLSASPFREVKPTAKGQIAVISIGRLQLQSVPELGVQFECRHTPRSAAVRDPHSDLLTNPPILEWPSDAAFRLAIQQFICDQVIHSEAGKVRPLLPIANKNPLN